MKAARRRTTATLGTRAIPLCSSRTSEVGPVVYQRLATSYWSPSSIVSSNIWSPCSSFNVESKRFYSQLPDAHIFNDAAEETLHAIQERLEVLEDLDVPDFDMEYAVP